MKGLKGIWVSLLVASVFTAGAQTEGEFDPFAVSEDTTATDSAAPMPEEPKGPPPYVRFAAPYDSLRELVYYSGVVEDEACEECMADSLYWRAKKYMTKKFGAKNLKDWTLEEKKAEKWVIHMHVPCKVTYNQYSNQDRGTVEYKLILRFKDNRWKWEAQNFVHLEPTPGVAGGVTKTYFEYYAKTQVGVKSNDMVLEATDKDLKDLIKGLTKALKEPFKDLEEDEW